MSVLYIAIPAALLLAIIGVAGFIWSVRGGQMDDLETPGIRPLLDDDPVACSPDNGDPPPSKVANDETG